MWAQRNNTKGKKGIDIFGLKDNLFRQEIQRTTRARGNEFHGRLKLSFITALLSRFGIEKEIFAHSQIGRFY